MKYLTGFSLSLIFILFFIFIGYVIRDKNIITSKPSAYIPLNSFKIYSLINDYRAKNNLPRLSWNPTICDFANIRLKQIHTDFSHNGYNPQYQKFYNASFTGENLARGSYSEQDVVNNWINSPEHRTNIINSHYTQTCVQSNIGYFINGTNITYSVQEFASIF